MNHYYLTSRLHVTVYYYKIYLEKSTKMSMLVKLAMVAVLIVAIINMVLIDADTATNCAKYCCGLCGNSSIPQADNCNKYCCYPGAPCNAS
ncbi:unnamed protein product [Medioppia subpectinata]|uniref:Uncharacterized protein n=1 Tax=Medioppia subpectinata TaxID=1979941 RepID=A0A7R9QA86_9ACAR|nr:unnamed protein product [Medioppia subpectinata]CAG2117257.1 unnamed protein product [Medioppia subpectinata]